MQIEMMQNLTLRVTAFAVLLQTFYCQSFYSNGKTIRLISNFLKSQPGIQTIPIHILPIISRSTDNQTMKFGQSVTRT